MKSKKSDVVILTNVLCDIEKSLDSLRNYRDESNHDRSVEYEKIYLRFQKIVMRRLLDSK